MKSIRLKTLIAMVGIALVAVVLMRSFHGFYVLYDPSYLTSGLNIFVPIVASLIIIAAISMFIIGTPLDRFLKRIKGGETPTEELKAKIQHQVHLYPLVIISVNLLSFFIGPLILYLAKGVPLGTPLPILTTLYNMGIGLIAALVEIQIIHTITLPVLSLLKLRQREEGTKRDMDNRHKMILIFLSLVYAMVTLFLAALYGTLSQLAAGNIPLEIQGLLFRFLPLGIILFPLFFLVISAATRENDKRIFLLKQRLAEITEGDGDLTQRFNLVRQDNLGEITSNLNALMDKIQNLLRNIHRTTLRVQGSSVRLSSSADKTTDALEALFDALQEVESTVNQQKPLAEKAKESVAHLGESIGQVSDRTGSQASVVEESSAAVEEMAKSIKSVAATTRQAKEISETLQSTASQGGETVASSTEAIQKAAETTSQVKEKVKLISQIAAQTNLLSMNAAIEAAHAGDSGRGFAVVADEIRKLANNSSRGAGEISDLMKEMEQRIHKGVQLSGQTNSAFESILKNVAQNTDFMESISSAMEEQRAGADEMLKSIAQLVDATKGIERLVQEQKSRSPEMQKSLEEFIQSFNTIGDSVQIEIKKIDALAEISLQLKTIADSNESSVNDLEQNVKQFQIQ